MIHWLFNRIVGLLCDGLKNCENVNAVMKGVRKEIDYLYIRFGLLRGTVRNSESQLFKKKKNRKPNFRSFFSSENRPGPPATYSGRVASYLPGVKPAVAFSCTTASPGYLQGLYKDKFTSLCKTNEHVAI
jgi:hypothetical protein